MHAQEVARRIFGAVVGEAYTKSSQDSISHQQAISSVVSGEIYHKSRHTKYPSQTLIPRITLFAICLSFSSTPLHPCHFIRLFPVCFSCAMADSKRAKGSLPGFTLDSPSVLSKLINNDAMERPTGVINESLDNFDEYDPGIFCYLLMSL